MVQRRVKYSWTMPYRWWRFRGDIDSHHVPAQVVENCFGHLRLCPVGVDNNFMVAVYKTNPTPIKAELLLEIKNYQVRHEAPNWVDACHFACVYHFEYEAYNLSCEITWTLPDDPPTLSDPPRALVLPTEYFLMRSSLTSDVTIVIGNAELAAHKVILSGCSSIFCQMLSNPMNEAETNRIIVDDIDLDTMKTVLTFLYKGKCEGLSEVPVACKVLAVAHKYDMQYLKETCVHNLQQQVNVKNVVEILELADRYGKEQLKRVCWEVVMQNKDEILPIDQFINLCATNPAIMQDFMLKIVNKFFL